jgi:hypothetical protein
MANASKLKFGAGAQGKCDGSGAMTEIPEDLIEENQILSNRDKSRHSGERGLDSKTVQTEQYQDHVANRLVEVDEDEAMAGNVSGLSGPKSDTSSDHSSLKPGSGK